jgi:2-amino-4-hydroxy-6-hydroxymethyldihydropteridine diphosphokinase
MNTVYLLLGSNIGKSRAHLNNAALAIEQRVGKVLGSSSFYKTAAWGLTDQPDFLNRILIIETEFTPQETLQKILKTEENLGRIRTIKNAARIIDIDILFFNREIINTKNLTVPHSEIPNRRFVLEPLAELSPDFIHPVSQKTVAQLLAECTDNLNVQKI